MMPGDKIGYVTLLYPVLHKWMTKLSCCDREELRTKEQLAGIRHRGSTRCQQCNLLELKQRTVKRPDPRSKR